MIIFVSPHFHGHLNCIGSQEHFVHNLLPWWCELFLGVRMELSLIQLSHDVIELSLPCADEAHHVIDVPGKEGTSTNTKLNKLFLSHIPILLPGKN